MLRRLWCYACGQPRTLDTAMTPTNGPMTCFRCGEVVFTTMQDSVPPLPAKAWVITRFDRIWLREIGIASSEAVQVRVR